MNQKSAFALGTVATCLLTACSMDFIPVHYSRLKSAREAKEPLQRGPKAPGAFTKTWNFEAAGGYRLDPARVEIAGGVIRLKPIAAGKMRFSTQSAIVETSSGRSYAALDSFLDVPGTGNKGNIRYQISNDAAQWYYYNGTAWVVGSPNLSQANTAAEINAQIGHFHTEIGEGSVFVKIFLQSPTGNEPVELKQVQIRGIAPKTDRWD